MKYRMLFTFHVYSVPQKLNLTNFLYLFKQKQTIFITFTQLITNRIVIFSERRQDCSSRFKTIEITRGYQLLSLWENPTWPIGERSLVKLLSIFKSFFVRDSQKPVKRINTTFLSWCIRHNLETIFFHQLRAQQQPRLLHLINVYFKQR